MLMHNMSRHAQFHAVTVSYLSQMFLPLLDSCHRTVSSSTVTTWPALHLHCKYMTTRTFTRQSSQHGLTFDAATVVTATKDAEVHKLVSCELEAFQHLVIVILLDGQFGCLRRAQVANEAGCGKCQSVHVLCGYCINLHQTLTDVCPKLPAAESKA